MSTEQPIPILDDEERIRAVDKRDMLRLITELPEQYETALGVGRSFPVEPLVTKPNVVFITGVGDSGNAADMIAATVGEDMGVPLVSDHSGRLPAYVGEESLVFVVDYLGKSQSALRNYKEARLRNANVICITSGGKLREAATKDGAGIVRIPPGQPARSAIGYLYAPVVVILEQMGLVTGAAEKLSFAIRLLKNVRESFRSTNPTARNLAKQTAMSLVGKTPVVYGAAGYRVPIAKRWESQIGANAKTPACAGAFPDVTDSEISAWESAERNYAPTSFVFLSDALDKTTEVRTVMDATKEILERFDVAEIEVKGNTAYEKLLYGIYLGDFISFYLAILYGVNPTTTEYVSLVAERFGEPAQ